MRYLGTLNAIPLDFGPDEACTLAYEVTRYTSLYSQYSVMVGYRTYVSTKDVGTHHIAVLGAQDGVVEIKWASLLSGLQSWTGRRFENTSIDDVAKALLAALVMIP